MKFTRDHLKRFGVCLAVAFSASSIEAYFGAPIWHSFIAGFIAGAAICVGKEYDDHCAPGNRWDWSDIATDMVGASVGSILGSAISLLNQ